MQMCFLPTPLLLPHATLASLDFSLLLYEKNIKATL